VIERAGDTRIFLAVYQPGSATTPLTPEARQQFADYVTAIMRDAPEIRDVIIGNEPNLNRFWMPQFDASGGDVAAPAYLALLFAVYDAVQQVDPDVAVWGGALAPRGIDRPGTGRDTHSPARFILDLGAAYRASHRTKPIMDAFTYHPYMERSDLSPTLRHPRSKTLTIADYRRLVSLLGRAFGGTEQPGSKMPNLNLPDDTRRELVSWLMTLQ